MTFPATATCMMCHNKIGKDRPAIQKLTELATFRRKMERAKPHLVGLDAVDSGQNIHY
jgi:hypothetical protein